MYKKGFLAKDSSWERTDLFFFLHDRPLHWIPAQRCGDQRPRSAVGSRRPTRPGWATHSHEDVKNFWLCGVSHFLVFALHLYVSYVQSHHFPWLQPHELQSIRSSRLSAIRTHHPISHVSLGEAHSRLPHTVFPPKGLLLSGQGGCSRRPYQG